MWTVYRVRVCVCWPAEAQCWQQLYHQLQKMWWGDPHGGRGNWQRWAQGCEQGCQMLLATPSSYPVCVCVCVCVNCTLGTNPLKCLCVSGNTHVWWLPTNVPGGMVPVVSSKWYSRVLKQLGNRQQPAPNKLHTGICISWVYECTRAGGGGGGSNTLPVREAMRSGNGSLPVRRLCSPLTRVRKHLPHLSHWAAPGLERSTNHSEAWH